MHSVGHFYPENELTNDFFENLDIGTTTQWILERTGIRSRRTVLPLDYIRETRNRDVRAAQKAAAYSNADIGKRAALMAIEQAGIDPRDIGLVIGGGSVPDHGTPAEACVVAAALNIDAPAYDQRSACTSFGTALWSLSLMRPEALPDYVLLVAPESVTRSVNYDDRRSAVLGGDAAAAAVLSTRVASKATILETSFCSNPKNWPNVLVPWAGYFVQQGQAVQSFAIKTMAKLLAKLRRRCREDGGRGFRFIGHQANLRMLDSVAGRCELKEGEHLYNVTDYGNTATAGSPSVLSESWDRLQPGDHVALIGVGAGMSWTSALIRFERQ